ncbi:MAG: phosphotransferase family protein [Acidimicrobiia bacterium]|nr:phosphotransferase family protein [Acidimicrobiia bacterium]
MTTGPRPPSLAAYLGGLAATVKGRLAPAADGEHLRGELYALASTLRLLAGLVEDLPAELADDEAALTGVLDVLDALGPGGDDLRGRLAAVFRDRVAGGGDGLLAHPAVRSYLARDLARRHAALFGPAGGAPPEGVAAEGRGRSLADPGVRARLEAFLAECLDAPDLRITVIAGTTQGFAAETVVCTVEAAGGTPQRMVVRAQWPELLLSAIPAPVERQAAAMAVARRAGLPVPRVHGVAPGEEPVGAPLHVTEHVEGSVLTPWTPEGRALLDRIRESLGPVFLDHLAALHAADWRGSGLVEETAGDALSRLRARLERVESLYRQAELRPDPLVDLALGWLSARADQWGEEVLIHGDFRPGNLIFGEDGSVRAVIDWDASKVTDFHEELGQLTLWAYRQDGLACGLFPDERLLGEYASRTGREIDPAGLRYYQVLMTIQHLLVFVILARSWLDRGGDVRGARTLFTLADSRSELGRLLGVT